MVLQVNKKQASMMKRLDTLRSDASTKKGRDKLMKKLSVKAAQGAVRSKNRKGIHKRGRQGLTSEEIWQQMGATAKLLVSYCQVLSQLEHAAGEPFPINFEQFCADFNIVNLDIMQFFTFVSPCDFSAPFDTKFYGHMSIVPIFIIVLLLARQTVVMFKTCCGDRVKFTKTSAKMNATRILAGVIFVMYPGLSVKCFRVFNCMEINGRSYLMADLVVSCDEDTYLRLNKVAYGAIIVYVMGIPLCGAIALSKWRAWFVVEDEMSDEMHEAMIAHPELREQHH